MARSTFVRPEGTPGELSLPKGRFKGLTTSWGSSYFADPFDSALEGLSWSARADEVQTPRGRNEPTRLLDWGTGELEAAPAGGAPDTISTADLERVIADLRQNTKCVDAWRKARLKKSAPEAGLVRVRIQVGTDGTMKTPTVESLNPKSGITPAMVKCLAAELAKTTLPRHEVAAPAFEQVVGF